MTMELAKQLDEHSKTLEAQGKAFNDMKTVLDSYGENSAEAKAMADKIDQNFEVLEKKNQELMTNFSARETAEKEFKERIDDLEAQLARPGVGHNVDPEVLEAKANMAALNTVARLGFDVMGVEAQHDEKMMAEVKRLRTDSNIDGGFLVESEFVREILKDITEISPMRSISRVRSTTRKTVMVPTRTSRVASAFNGEGLAALISNSQYGLEEMTMGKLSVATIITNEELSDASFNMEVEIRDDVLEEFARAEGASFVSGNGVNRPQGFLTDANVQFFTTGTAGIIKGDDLIAITGELKTGYNPVFTLNRRTLASIRQLKDGNGQYLWAPGIASGLPNTIIGEPYVSMIDMPDVATGQDAVAYGDFRRGYWIVDRTSMTMIRDNVTRAGTDEVVLTFHRRLTGQVVKAEAIKKIRVG